MRNFFALSLLFFASFSPCFAMMSIGSISRERAKTLGMTVQAKPAGPDAVWVGLEFDTNGDLESFHRVDLEITEGEKLLVSGALLDRRSSPGHVVVSLTVARAHLDQVTLRVVVGMLSNMSGYDLRLKDFVDLDKLH